MYTYLWLVKDAAGNETAQRITAESAQAAHQQLHDLGYTDLRLIKDDVMAETTAKSEHLAQLTPESEAKVLQAKRESFARVLLKTMRDTLILWAVCAFGIWRTWYRATKHGNSLIVFWLEIAAMLLGIPVFFFIHLNAYLFRVLNEAREWHRADEVLRLVRWLSILGPITRVKIQPHELGRYRALAHVWQGDAEKALAEMERWESQFSPWLFATHVASIYDALHETDRMIEFAERAVALNPNTATAQIDLAWRYLASGRSLERAKEAMANADKLVAPELAQPFLLRNRGIIAFLENRFDESEKLLTGALSIWEENKDRFFRDTNIATTKAWLCQLHARVGRVADARRDFAEARPWLEAAHQTFLLEKCAAAV